MTVEPTWHLALALGLLVALAVVVSWRARLGIGRQVVIATLRAILQLGVVSLIVVTAIQHVWSSVLFVSVMFAIGTYTTCKRTGVRRAWPWTAVAMAAGVLPVLAIIFGTRVAPLNGFSLIPIGSIVVGNMMTGHTLAGRRLFSELRDNIPTYEAALSVGLERAAAIGLVTENKAVEALVPTLDSTRTVGLVTLPGAFVGVLLGGGSAVQAGAAQVLVLVGILVGQTLTVSTAHQLMKRAKLLPPDLKERLRP